MDPPELPKRVQAEARHLLTQIPYAPTRQEATKRRDHFRQTVSSRVPRRRRYPRARLGPYGDITATSGPPSSSATSTRPSPSPGSAAGASKSFRQAQLQRAQTILENWVRARASDSSGPSESVQAARREIARIERAIFEGDDRPLDEYGDVQAGLERIVELKELQRLSRSRAAIVRISEQSGHSFRSKVATQFGAKWPPVSV